MGAPSLPRRSSSWRGPSSELDQRSAESAVPRAMLWLDQRPRHPHRRGLRLLRTRPHPRHARGPAPSRRARARRGVWALGADAAASHAVRAPSALRLRPHRHRCCLPARATARPRSDRTARPAQPPARAGRRGAGRARRRRARARRPPHRRSASRLAHRGRARDRSAGLQRDRRAGERQPHGGAARVHLHDAFAAPRRRGHRARRPDRRGRVSASARGHPGAVAPLRHAASCRPFDQLADRRGRRGRLRGDPGHQRGLERPHDRRPRRGAAPPGPRVAAPHAHPAAAVPYEGLLAVRASNALRPLWPRRLDLRRILMHDFPLKAVAVLVAVVFAIANAQNAAPREIVAAFDGRVPVERPDVPVGFVLRGQLGDVGVTLRGPEGVADRMALSDLHATLSVRLERITSRNVVVQTKFANEPPKGSQAAQTSVSPKEVRVVGPESAVAQIAAVFATVRFGDVTTDLTQSAPAIPVDASGLPIDGLQVEPGVVVVSVPLLPTATTRTVPLLWSLHGTVAAGYWSSRVTTDPVAVTISGDQAVLAQIERIDTAAVDVTALAATKTFRVPLVLPDGVTLLQPVDVSVTVTVVPLAGTRPFLEAVQIQNVGSSFVAETDVGSVTVTVAGPAPALTAMTVDQVVVTVDASGKGPGTYTVDAVVRVPTGVTAQSVQPQRV